MLSIEPGEEHWHGATPDRFTAFVAMQEADESVHVVIWLDHDTDEKVEMPIVEAGRTNLRYLTAWESRPGALAIRRCSPRSAVLVACSQRPAV